MNKQHNNHFIITTLAEYQTDFWVLVADAFKKQDRIVIFVSFDDRSTELLRTRGYVVFSANEVPASPAGDEILKKVGFQDFAFWSAHERFAFGRADDDAMRAKLARAIIATEYAINHFSDDERPILVQELGGFLSVIGAFFTARAYGLTNWFIEPSFFRGRLLFTPNTFAAPAIDTDFPVVGADECNEYIETTLHKSAIVIPLKDRHQYSSAQRKIFNLVNAKRLIEKMIDKYILGKRQEFGFIGSHVKTHLLMLSNSRKLSSHYTILENLDNFVYYPLHVPGDMALTVRSPEYLDQLAFIDYVARSTPDGMRLGLKEHPAMIGMINADRLISLLNRYPHLALIPPGTNNYEVMRKAAAVLTVNSKSGAEAGLIERPVVVLGDAFYKNAPFAISLDRRSLLPDVLRRIACGEIVSPSSETIRSYFAGIWPHTFPGELYVTDEQNIAVFTASLTDALDRLHSD